MNLSFSSYVSRLRLINGIAILGLGIIGSSVTASAQLTTASATKFIAVRVARNTDAATTSSNTAWVDVPGASLSLNVAPGVTNLFIADYTAESICTGSFGWCSVRILINGAEANPQVGTDFAFDSTDGGTASAAGWKGHAVNRSLKVANTGTKSLPVTVKVQYIVTSSGSTFRLDDWHLTVQQFQ